MKNYTMDDYVLLSETKAVRKYFDSGNFKWFTRLLVVMFIYGTWCLGMMYQNYEQPVHLLAGYGGIVAVNFALFLVRHRNSVERSFNALLVNYLTLNLIALVVIREDYDEVTPWLFFYPLILLLFRLRLPAYFMLYCLILGLTAADSFYPDDEGMLPLAVIGVACFGCILISTTWTALNRRKFLAVWRIERNNRERLRMKEELDHAREIQLSMLPPGQPEVANLELACCSVPATEVGGDYYDYFRISDSKLAMVIGDVSGHGVASGLVLSGVRSCLYLLKDELPKPPDLLSQLNRMLKQTTDRKTFMTFLCVVFDTENKKLVLSSAGHPPMLYFKRADQSLQEIRQIALPLGGIMKSNYEEMELEFESGDVFLFYTDGLIEATNASRTEFGLNRLMPKFKSLAAKAVSAEHIRQILMTDVQLHIGDTEQLDDITLVVMRAR